MVQQAYIAQKAIVWNKDRTRILALLRGATAPSGPLTWDFPGGDLEQNEDMEASIRREIQEETGIIVSEVRLVDNELHLSKSDSEFWLTAAYEAFSDTDEVSISWEHDEFRWVTLDEFLELPSRQKLLKFVRTIKNRRS